MQTVDLIRCKRCLLVWQDGTERVEGVCPSCQLQWSVPQAPVTVAGFAVSVATVMAHGRYAGLLDPKVRRGLGKLNLYDRCEHGLMTRLICNDCR
jgi:hypothetical protein